MAGFPHSRTPQDETLWRNPIWYRAFGPLHSNNVMQYFHDSPFFDPVSSNGDLMSQIEHNMQIRMKITSQEEFDNHLKKMKGLEFIVFSGSTENGVWIIRKQERKSPDHVIVLSTYYVAGENIYQAPAINAVLENRIMTIMRDLRYILDLANSTPGVYNSGTAFSAGSVSRFSIEAQLWAPPLFNRAIHQAIQHKNEYMDDHGPLVGDPGSLLTGSIPHNTQSQSQRSMDRPRSGTATPGLSVSLAPEARGNFRK